MRTFYEWYFVNSMREPQEQIKHFLRLYTNSSSRFDGHKIKILSMSVRVPVIPRAEVANKPYTITVKYAVYKSTIRGAKGSMQLALTEVKLNDNFKPVLSAQPRALTDKEAHKKTLVVSMAAKAVKAGKYFDNTLLLSLNSKLLELQGQCDNTKKRKVHKSTQSNGKKRKVADNKNTRCSNDGRVIKATHSFVTKSEVKPVISDDQFRPRLFLSL